jgi:alkanesulfonate monooxygenase SsuD/methylene tetrahydromethanopterin reductase-like flavin-dependent oxidoreductase (luciferase family)
MDECLTILRGLASGEAVSFEGEFFSLRDAVISPAPSPPIPLMVGGRSQAAVRRAARFGDGWVAIWVSPERVRSAAQQIADQAAGAGRDPHGFEHALNVWCGFGSTRETAREPLAAAMQSFYRMPFDPFERYSPHGTPQDVAAFLQEYVEAGCSVFNLIACAHDQEAAVAGVGELRTILRTAA